MIERRGEGAFLFDGDGRRVRCVNIKGEIVIYIVGHLLNDGV